MAQPPLVVAAATRPYPGETANGDAWSVQWTENACRIAVIDGLGHGPAAAAAARAATDTLAAHPDLAPDEALRLCHQALAGTRGAAISIARIEPAGARLIYAGVGNIEARLWQAAGLQRPIAYRGIVGATLRTIRPFELRLEPQWLLFVHTDGVSARFEPEGLSAFTWRDPQRLADEVLRGWGRPTDDATVVVVCPRDVP
jgi:serine phosphatase RsbU (regulator of sigma subunit)